MWTDRLYAFLLRRILGPILSEASYNQLHSLLQVSVSQGTYKLVNVELNPDYFKLNGIRILVATAKSLEIQLSLVEKSSNDDKDNTSSSVYWKALQLTTSAAATTQPVHLRAKVLLDGVCLKVTSGPRHSNAHTVPAPTEEEAIAAPSVVSSYMQTALHSLRLSVAISNLELVVQHHNEWLSFSTEHITYKEDGPTKTLTVSRLHMQVGTATESGNVLLLDGTCVLSLAMPQPHNKVQTVRVETQFPKLNVSVDAASIGRTVSIVHSFFDNTRPMDADLDISDSTTVSEHRLSYQHMEEEEEDDVEDVQVLDTIMQQYQMARTLAEQQLVRGGVLVADASQSFDAFFDANQFSLSRYSTVLQESMLQPEEHPMKTHLDVTLGELGVKVVLVSSSNHRPSDEYLLFSVYDIHLCSTLSSQEVSHALTIQTIEADDAIAASTPPPPTTTGRSVEIGTLLRFLPSDASCLSLQVDTTRGTEKDTLHVDLTLGALELCCRPAMVSKLGETLRSLSIKEKPTNLEDAGMVIVESEQTPRESTVAVAVPSIEIHVPLAPCESGKWNAMFERCGYCVKNHLPIVLTPSLGLLLSQLSVEYSECETREEAIFNCRSIIAFASAPRETTSVFDTISERFDFLALSSHDEVDPCIPIALTVTKCLGDSSDGPAVQAFPKVLPISSFKAREEDDDDDTRIDGVLNPPDLKVNSRKETRGADPQSVMLPQVATSDVIICCRIPEIIGDICVPELLVLKGMIAAIEPGGESTEASRTDEQKRDPFVKRISVALECTFMSMSLHSGIDDFMDSFSVILVADRFKAHSLLDGSFVKQSRILIHEIDLYEAAGVLSSFSYEVNCPASRRVSALRDRGATADNPETKATPILHRSHLFSPMSRDHPSLLLDVLSDTSNDLIQRNVYFTIYDTTYRYNLDSRWVPKLIEVLQKSEKSREDPDTDDRQEHVDESLIRLFFTVSDCNFDYSSSPRFATPSRAIIRIGELHVSSNIPFPRAKVQACRVSIADVSLLLSNDRFPYCFENRSLVRSRQFLDQEDCSLAPLRLAQDSESDDVERMMNLKSLLTIDTVDSVIVLNSKSNRPSQDPIASASLTVGPVAVFACKDSFSCLTKTIGEAVAELTAVSDDKLIELRKKSFCSASTNHHKEPTCEDETSFSNYGVISQQEFLLDGYDWTTIDSDELGKDTMPSEEEQTAKWYGNVGETQSSFSAPRIISHHFQLNPASDPIGDGDMGAMKYAGTSDRPSVKSRILLHDMSVKIRLFDGYDWPESVNREAHTFKPDAAFVIPEVSRVDSSEERDDDDSVKGVKAQESDDASKLMGELLAGEPPSSSTFQNLPLPEEKSKLLKDQSDLRRLARRTDRYFQLSFCGLSSRLDSFEECDKHKLASCLNLKAADFFVAETISAERPIKMVGEWFNEEEHPRDSKNGLLMMKMVTWHPEVAVTAEDDIVSDESKVALKLLPLRCRIDQRAISFARAFFDSREKSAEQKLPQGFHIVPPPLFTSFRVHGFRLKVDYTPQKLDSKALRDGAVVELINLSPLDGMVLTLQKQEVQNEVGFGAVIGIFAARWVRDICSTQLLKFVTKSRPLEPITQVSGAAVDMVVLPWEAFRNGEGIQKALRSGAKGLSKSLVYEFCSLTSRAAEFFAGTVSRASIRPNTGELLPSRPTSIPRGLVDASPHAAESISRGFQAANYKIIIVPYREFQRSGATGAAKSIIKGIPVAIAAPASGAAEALSFALLGARNSVRPDIWKEDEASIRGLIGDS